MAELPPVGIFGVGTTKVPVTDLKPLAGPTKREPAQFWVYVALRVVPLLSRASKSSLRRPRVVETVGRSEGTISSRFAGPPLPRRATSSSRAACRCLRSFVKRAPKATLTPARAVATVENFIFSVFVGVNLQGEMFRNCSMYRRWCIGRKASGLMNKFSFPILRGHHDSLNRESSSPPNRFCLE